MVTRILRKKPGKERRAVQRIKVGKMTYLTLPHTILKREAPSSPWRSLFFLSDGSGVTAVITEMSRENFWGVDWSAAEAVV